MRPSSTAPTIIQEKMLLDQIRRLNRLREGRIAVCVHFSELSNAYQRDRFKTIAEEAFNSYVSGFEGTLYVLHQGDLFFLGKNVTKSALEAAVDRLQRLFTQDPLIEAHTIEGKSKFSTYYDLEENYDDLLDWVENIVRIAEAKDLEQETESESPPLQPIALNMMTRLEGALRTIDVTNIARRQTVCTLMEGNAPQPLFEEIYISIGALQETATPGVLLAANRWLFQHLTHTLDFRLMDMLIRDGIKGSRPFSLNLNVSTILSPSFAKFEAIITPQLRGRLVIEFDRIDVFSDMGSFLFARDYLHDRGFRLCLDGVTHHTMPYFNRAKLGFDLVKVYWTPNSLDTMLPSMKPELRNIVMETGQAHIILCRCDDDTAIKAGQDLGIVMFQGHEVDRIMSKTNIKHEYRF